MSSTLNSTHSTKRVMALRAMGRRWSEIGAWRNNKTKWSLESVSVHKLTIRWGRHPGQHIVYNSSHTSKGGWICISAHYTEAYLYKWARPEMCSISTNTVGLKLQNSLSSYCSKLNTSSLLLNACTLSRKEYHTSRFCRRKANTVSTSAVRAATISLLRGGASPSGKVWISSVRRRKISRTSSTCVVCWEREKDKKVKVQRWEKRSREIEKKDDCQVGVFLFATVHMYAPHTVWVYSCQRRRIASTEATSSWLSPQ